MWSRVELKEDSKALLKLNYWPFVLVAFVHAAVTGGGAGGSGANASSRYKDSLDLDMDDFYGYGNRDYSGFFSSVLLAVLGTAFVVIFVMLILAVVLDIFVFNPLEVGCKRYMTMARDVKPQFGEMVFAFRNCYGNVVKTMFLMDLYVFLWSLLFVIPGIVKSYEYRMVPYLMAEYPDMASSEAFRISREMMTGNKWETFVLDLSFIGWNILSTITIGLVGIFYVGPYEMLTNAALYLTLKKTNPSFGYVQPDDNYYYHNGQF